MQTIVRAAAGDKYRDAESCKGIAAALAYRLKKHEWSDASTFHELATRHNLPMQRPTDEEFLKMAEHIGRIFLEKSWSGLPREYVFFHSASAALSAQPWDTEVLATENRKSVGAFTFYRYKADAKFHATILIVKEIKLVAGGDKGMSLPCAPGEPLSVSNEGAVRPYRYDLQSNPKWDFEFRFNIQSGTSEIEDLKKALEWELRYTRKNNESFEKIKMPVTHSANRFSLTIPAEVYGYSVELVPMVDVGIALCSEFTIAIRKREQLLFNGKVIRWLSESGEVVPFDDNVKQVEEIAACSGNAGKREKEHAGVQNEGPVPEGVWWVARNNLQSYEKLVWWEQTLDKFLYKKWPGGEKRWGNYRVWMEADKGTDIKGREELSICGGDTEQGGGDIHLKDGIGLFVRNFISRVQDGGRLMLQVDYSQPMPPKRGISESAFQMAARKLDVELAAIKAVAEVEAKGDGFLSSGHPKILFESHHFSRLTNAEYDVKYPKISHKYKDPQTGTIIRNYLGGEKEVTDRLNVAVQLNETAALQSASWGRFQIMGFNHASCGYSDVKLFVKDMKVSEDNHLKAFIDFIEANKLMHVALKDKNWDAFAKFYNGVDYKSNQYDIKLENAYKKYLKQS